MKVTITGGAGFIGANLSRELLSRGATVRVVDNLLTGSEQNLDGLAVDLRIQSILDDAAEESLADSDAIVHLAAVPSVPRSVKDPLTSHEANATGTLRVLEAARRTNSYVIVASSSSVYGANPVLPKTESMRPMPISPYAVSKLATESYAISYQHCYDLPTLAFRFFNVYGPLQAPGHAYAAVVPSFTDSAVREAALTVHGDGTQTRDFTYVGTVTETISQAIEGRITSVSPVNLAFGTRYSLLELISLIEQKVGHSVKVDHVDPRPGDVRDSQADSTLLRSLFPAVLPVALTDGLTDTIEWMRRVAAPPHLRDG